MESRLISYGDLSLAKEIDTDIRAIITKKVTFKVFNNQYGVGATNCNRYYPFGCWITRDARAAR